MYPNYTKAFLNLEGVSIKKVVQADSFIKIFIQSQPVEQTCPCCGAKTKRIHDYRLQEVQDIPLLGNQVILRLTSFHKRFPLTNSKAMLLPVNISAFWLIRKSVGSSTFSRIGPKAIWLIIGGTFPGKNA